MRNPLEPLWKLFEATKNDPESKKLVSVRVNENLWKLYSTKASAEGITVQDAIENLLEKTLRRELKIEDKNGEEEPR